jgi:hypothetical protein
VAPRRLNLADGEIKKARPGNRAGFFVASAHAVPHRHCDPGLEPGEAIQGLFAPALDCFVGFASSQ